MTPRKKDMKKSFEPQLGQLLMSNSPWESEELSEYLEALLQAIGEEIERVEWNNQQQQYESPINNNGEVYETDRFKMEAYCWCDGDLHKEGCPPNFLYKPNNFRVRWYKYLGRGSSMSRSITEKEAVEMFQDCLESVRRNEKPLESGSVEKGK